MTCAHSNKPGPCSQCVDVKPRVVTHDGPLVLVDGVAVDPPPSQSPYGKIPTRTAQHVHRARRKK